MAGSRQLCPLLAGFFALALPFNASASSLEVPPAHTGGFGQPDCTACHFENDVHEAGTNLSLEGLPAAYQPGQTYDLTIRLADPALRVGGFLLSARAAGTMHCGSPAGALEPVDGRTEKVLHGLPPVEYLRSVDSTLEPHSAPTAIWRLKWTAPDYGNAYVVFHLTANAGNGDGSPLGDQIYALEIILPPKLPYRNQP